MEKIEIRRPYTTDIVELHELFFLVIADTFAKEGLSELHEDQHAEWEMKKRYLKWDLESYGTKRHFLLAVDEDKNRIIGTIECGPANELIQKTVKEDLTSLPEIGTVFVLPRYQKHGVGTLLLQKMISTLQIQGLNGFCLDSGYKNAQAIWQKKFGSPDYVLKHYWGENSHHMIWKRRFPLD